MGLTLVLGVQHYSYMKEGAKREGGSCTTVDGTPTAEDRGAGFLVADNLRLPYGLAFNMAQEMGQSAAIYDLEIVAQPDPFNRGQISAVVKDGKLVRLLDLKPLLAPSANGGTPHK